MPDDTKELKLKFTAEAGAAVAGTKAVQAQVEGLAAQTQKLTALETARMEAAKRGQKGLAADLEAEISIRKEALALQKKGMEEARAFDQAVAKSAATAPQTAGQGSTGSPLTGTFGSLFGKLGAIAGVSATVGGVLNVIEHLGELRKEERLAGEAHLDMMGQFTTSLAGAGWERTLGAVNAMTASIKAMKKEAAEKIPRLEEDPLGFVKHNVGDAISGALGGRTDADRRAEIFARGQQMDDAGRKALAQAAEDSSRQTQVSRLRLAGYDAEAEKMARELALKKQLAELDAMKLPNNGDRDAIAADLKEQAANRELMIARQLDELQSRQITGAQIEAARAQLIAEHRDEEAAALARSAAYAARLAEIDKPGNGIRDESKPGLRAAAAAAFQAETAAAEERAALKHLMAREREMALAEEIASLNRQIADGSAADAKLSELVVKLKGQELAIMRQLKAGRIEKDEAERQTQLQREKAAAEWTLFQKQQADAFEKRQRELADELAAAKGLTEEEKIGVDLARQKLAIMEQHLSAAQTAALLAGVQQVANQKLLNVHLAESVKLEQEFIDAQNRRMDAEKKHLHETGQQRAARQREEKLARQDERILVNREVDRQERAGGRKLTERERAALRDKIAGERATGKPFAPFEEGGGHNPFDTPGVKPAQAQPGGASGPAAAQAVQAAAQRDAAAMQTIVTAIQASTGMTEAAAKAIWNAIRAMNARLDKVASESGG